MSNRDYLFRAKTVEAYTIKSLSEVLQNILIDVCFIFDKDGIKLLTADNKQPSHILVHLNMNSESFDEYYCPKAQNVGINLQHLHKMLKSIKKKDQITLFISKERPNLLGFTTIQADSGQPVTSHIKIQKLSEIETNIHYEYGHPVHIATNSYQKLCKNMQGMSTKINIFSKGNYLLFKCSSEGIYDQEFPFGELDEQSNDDIFEDDYFTKSLSQLIKVSGLNSRMQVYIPLVNVQDETPLKLSISTGSLGRLDIYIKSIRQIEG